MRFLCRLIATGFYSGFCPIAPGTAGSLMAILVYGLIPTPNPFAFLLVLGLLFLIGVWVSTEVEKTHGHDASVITIDEMVGMGVSVFYLPFPTTWFWLAGAFLLFRLFDIVKPFPAGAAQKLPKGWGVMVDDVAAGIYANLSLRLIHWIVIKAGC